MRAGPFGAVILAKTQHNALFIGINNINTRKKPQNHNGKTHKASRPSVGEAHAGYFGKRIFAIGATAIVKRSASGARGFFFLPHIVRIHVLRRSGRRVRTLLLSFFLKFVPVPIHNANMSFKECVMLLPNKKYRSVTH